MTKFLTHDERRILDKTIEVHDRDGWIQGTSIAVGGQEKCLLATIDQARCELTVAYTSLDLYAEMINVERAIAEVVGEDIVDWNDTEGRTAEQVRAALVELQEAQP